MGKTYVITVETDNPWERDMGHTNGTWKLYPVEEIPGMVLEDWDLEELKSAEDYFLEQHQQIVDNAYQRGYNDAKKEYKKEYEDLSKHFDMVIENEGAKFWIRKQ